MSDETHSTTLHSRTDSNEQPTSESPFHIVGIGASAGGLDPLEKFFGNMPPETGMAFVVVQHLSPDFKSLMDELLARHTDMKIFRVEDGMPVEPNGIYLIPPKKYMALSYGKLLLTEQSDHAGLNMPIDFFFSSLASDCGDRAIAVVLSGTGSDGSRGVRDVHEAGGLVFVQDAKTAAFDGMPRNAEATGIADLVASADQIPRKILRTINHPQATAPEKSDEAHEEFEGEDSVIQEVFRLFRNRYGIDFRYYKPNTIERRLDRRIKLSQSGTIEAYLELLEEDEQELEALYRDLLVEVTEFFRDTAAFERLRCDVIPSLIEIAKPRDQIRAWVPGCATGEEAYSLAMLFHEAAEKQGRNLDIKIFATDVHRTSLESASTAVYSADKVQKVPIDLRSRCFTQHGDLCHVIQPVRQMVIFAPHDLTKDPPFTKIDVLSCRNVLIYLEPDVQKRVVSLFHFGMKVGGHMMLGPSETIGELSREFEVVDQHWRIYRKLRDVRLPDAISIPTSPVIERVVRPQTAAFVDTGVQSGAATFLTHAAEDLLERYVPPSLLVNDYFELVHSFGEARHFLVQPKGRPTLSVLKMVEGDLRMAISAGLHRAKRDQRMVVFEGVRVEGRDDQVKIVVEPYSKHNQSMFLVCLEPMKHASEPEPLPEDFRSDDQAFQRITDLERELDYTRESLQTTVEELESSNEELQSTNEELVASNEELQSTNEELHSVNEELYTVNSEHQRKIEELVELSTDMDNLMRSSEVATIFLDKELRIRKFTPAITAAFHVLEQDIGRPIQHIAYNFENPELLDEVAKVLESGESSETEVKTYAGKSYLKRILPYRSAEGTLEGVVITFVDVTNFRKMYDEMRNLAESLELSDHDMQEFAYAVSHDLQAPLRHMAHFAEELEEACGEENSKVAECNSSIRANIQRLQAMIAGLLDYSRVNSRGARFRSVVMNDMIQRIQEEMRDEIESADARISCGNLPNIVADEGQIEKVFRHLIDNAIKYRREDPPTIQIRARRDDDMWEFSIRDNGIGIAPKHFEKIFVIFRRLGMKDGVEGNGLGLPLSKRIVQRHDGLIRVKSIPGEGSTFFIRLPISHLKQGKLEGGSPTGAIVPDK